MYNISLNSDWASLEKKKQDPNIQLDRIREAVQKRQRSTSPGGHSSGPPGTRTRTLQPEQRQNGIIRSSPGGSPNRMRNSSSKKLEIGDKESPRENNDMALCTTVDEVFAKIREKRLAALNQSERLSKLPDEKEYDRAFRTASRDDIYQPLEYKQILQTVQRGPADLVLDQPNPDRLKYLKSIEKQARSGRKASPHESFEPYSTKRSEGNGYSTIAPQNSFAMQERMQEKMRQSGLQSGNGSVYQELMESQGVIPYRDHPLRSPSKGSPNRSKEDINIDEVEIVKSNRKARNNSTGKGRAGSTGSKASLEEREAGWVSNLNSKRGQPPKKPQPKANKGTSANRKELGEEEVMATFKAVRKQYQQQEQKPQKPLIQQDMPMDLPRKVHKVGDSDVEDVERAYEKSLSPERSERKTTTVENKKVQADPIKRLNANRPIMDEDDVVESYSIARGNNPRVEEIPFYRDLGPYARESAKDRNGESHRHGSSGFNNTLQNEDDPYIDPRNLSSHDVLRIVSGKISSQSLRRNFEYPDRPSHARQNNQYNRQISPARSTPTNQKYYRTPPKYLPAPQGLSSPLPQSQYVSQYVPQILTESQMQHIPSPLAQPQSITYTSIYPPPPISLAQTYKSNSRSPVANRNVSPGDIDRKDIRERSPLQARAQLISKMRHEAEEGDSEELVLIVKLVKEIENLKKAKADAEILPSLPSPERLRNEFSKKIEANLNKLLYTIAGEHSRNKSLKDVVNDLVASAHRFERKVYGPYRKNDLLVYALQEYKTLKDEKLRNRIITQEANKRGISPRRTDDMPHWSSVKNNYVPDNQYGSNYADPASQYASTGLRYSSKTPGSSSTSPIRGAGKGLYASTSKTSSSPYLKKKKEPENDEEGWINAN